MASPQFNVSVARNVGRPCMVRGCTRRRHQIGLHCHAHSRARNQHGHPLGRRIRPSEYATERKEVSTFLDQHQDHAGVQVALSFLQQWLDEARRDAAAEVPARSHLVRLSVSGVTPQDILREAAAVWLFSTRQSRTLPDDERLTYALGLAVLHLAPFAQGSRWVPGRGPTKAYRPPNGTARREAGEHLRNSLGPLLFNIATALDARKLASERTRSLLREPFPSASSSTTPTTTSTKEVHES